MLRFTLWTLVLSVASALAGLATGIDLRERFLLGALLVVASAGALTALRAEHAVAERYRIWLARHGQKRHAEQMGAHDTTHAGLSEIKDVLTGPNAASDLKSLGSAALQSRARQLAHDMRVFEAGHREQEMRLVLGEWTNRVRPHVTPEQQHAEWMQEMARSTASRAAFNHEYFTRFHGPAIALRDEMSRRLGMLSRESPSEFFALDTAMLTGPAPIEEVATYLESLAGRLTP